MNRLQRTTYCRLTSLLALLLALCLAVLPVRAAESSKLPLTMRLPVNVTFDQDGLDPKRSYVLSLVPENSGYPMPEEAADNKWQSTVSEENGTAYSLAITYNHVGEWWYALTLTRREDGSLVAQYWLHVMALQTDNGQQLVTTLHEGTQTGNKVSAVAFADAHTIPDTPVTPNPPTTETPPSPSTPSTPSETPPTPTTTETTQAATESTEETTEETTEEIVEETPSSGGTSTGSVEGSAKGRNGSVLPAGRDRLTKGSDSGDDGDVQGANRGRSPLTGDDSHLLLWMILCAASLCVLLVLGRGLRKKK